MSTEFEIQATVKNPITGEDFVFSYPIGRRSSGWVFTFNGSKYKTVREWKNFINEQVGKSCIVSEYGSQYTVEEFWTVVETTTEPWGATKQNVAQHQSRHGIWYDGGFDFCANEFA